MDIDGHDTVETGAVRAALVAELAHSTVPTSIMGCTLVGIATFAHASTGMKALLAAAVCGGLASAAKVALMQIQMRRAKLGNFRKVETRYWEAAHAIITGFVAASVGVAATAIFMQGDLNLQMLATGMMFGYGSGIVSLVSIRPKIAIPAILTATIVPIITMATWSDTPHHIIAAVFSAFLIGSFGSIRNAHQSAVKHVSMRLKMAALAQKDSLTGLANRVGLRTAFRAIGPDEPVAVFCLDLDGFKTVNDRYGHAAGDALLRMVAERLLAVTAVNGTVVRMGGDEFVILMPSIHRRGDLSRLAERITACLHKPFLLEGQDIRIGASVGHAASPFKPTDLDGLLIRADEESYRIKSTRSPKLPVNRTVSVLRGSIQDQAC